MGYINEPDGVTLIVEKKKLSKEVEDSISNFIRDSKKRNKKMLEKLKFENGELKTRSYK